MNDQWETWEIDPRLYRVYGLEQDPTKCGHFRRYVIPSPTIGEAATYRILADIFR